MAGRTHDPLRCGAGAAAMTVLLFFQACALGPVPSTEGQAESTVSVYFEGRNIEVVEGSEIRILFGEEVEESVRQKIIMQYGFYVDRRMIYGYFVYYINIMNPGRIEGVVRMLQMHPEVEKAEPNAVDGRSPFDL